MTRRQRAYRHFLQSKLWKSTRLQCLERDQFTCQHCKATDHLEAHHLWYPQRWDHTTPAMLVTLCKACHAKQHPERAKLPPKKRKKLNQVQKKLKRNWAQQARVATRPYTDTDFDYFQFPSKYGHKARPLPQMA